MKFLILASMVLAIASISCGNKNSFDCDSPTAGVPCNPRTKDEDARIALDKGDMATAVAILRELVSNEPEVYSRYPLFSAALAGKSGFDIFNVMNGSFGGDSSLLQSMGSFIPTPASKGSAFEASLADMKESVAVLNSIPISLRASVDSGKFASSCILQLTLYQAAYSIMLMNKYSYSEIGFDPSKLSTMTAEDAAAILQSLLSAASANPDSPAATSVNAAYESIQGQPGATDQEKISAYILANQ
jgi:hypothetical protein